MATDHTSVTQEPISWSFSSRLIGLTGEAASFVRAHPNLILTALTVLIAGEMWLAHARLLPVRIEWMLGWLFFLSIAGWSGTTTASDCRITLSGDCRLPVDGDIP